MPLSNETRQAQSRLANATKRAVHPSELVRLQNAFAVLRALDGIRAITAPISHEQASVLHSAIDRLGVTAS